MEIVIDAEIAKGYYEEAVLSKEDGLTASTLPLFNRIGVHDMVHFDSGGHIKAEWKALVDPMWFDAWYPGLLISGGAFEIDVETCYMTINTLKTYGFPDSKDVWYVRTAKAVVDTHGKSVLISEDIHFFDPSMGACSGKARKKILIGRKGKVCRFLTGKEKIEVHCVASYLERY